MLLKNGLSFFCQSILQSSGIVPLSYLLTQCPRAKCFLNLALTEMNTEIKFDLKLSVYSLDVDFEIYRLNLILVSLDGLQSLQEERCQKSIKQWVFDVPFHIENPG